MKILIIGGTRFIGKRIAEYSLRAGHEVILFNRGVSITKNQFPLIKGDIKDISQYKNELLSHKFDIVVHCIAYTEEHAIDTVDLFKDTNTRIVLLSSCDSYEAFQGLNRCIDKAELPVREYSQLSKMKYYWSDSKNKGVWTERYDKNLLTDILVQSFERKEIGLTVFRLPMVYGPEDYQYQGRHGKIIRRIIDKRKKIVFSDREQCQVYTFGYIENIAAAIIHSFDKDICDGKIYNLGEKYSRSLRRWTEMYASILGHEFEFHIVPEEIIRKDKNYRSAPPQHLIIDSTLYEAETGFTNPVTTTEAIKKTFDFAVQNIECLGDPPKYDEEDSLIDLYESYLDKIQDQL